MLEKSDEQNAYWCIVSGSDVWSFDGGIPFGTAGDFSIPVLDSIQIGTYQNSPVFWVSASSLDWSPECVSLRTFLTMDTELFHIISKAVQYGHMVESQRFCSACGGRNHFNHSQYAMQCQDCRMMHYPRINSCIIVAVRNGDKILLAQHPRHKTGMYTVIAGFVEVGETLEECVTREIYEETGIKVSNIRYQASQPWAFPSNIMTGFLADYASGEIKPDYSELSDAKWFGVDELPDLAPVGTIARTLIEQTLTAIRNGV